MTEIVQQLSRDVAQMMQDFGPYYIKTLINNKLQDAMDEVCETVIPEGLSEVIDNDESNNNNSDEKEDESQDVIEEKAEDEKEQQPPFVAGVCVLSYKSGIGPAGAEHRYYDCACFAIKPVDSVIVKVVKRHGTMLPIANTLKKTIAQYPKNLALPKKKMVGKDIQYYRTRMKLIHEYFESVSKVQECSVSDAFLDYFGLQYNEEEEYLHGVFMEALEQMCADNGIDWNAAQRRAEWLGLDTEAAEMLKFVAVEKLGKSAVSKLRTQVNSQTPDILPAKVKSKFVASAEGKLYAALGTNVEAGWRAIEKPVETIALNLNQVLDSGMDPIKQMFVTALEPIGKVIHDKFDALQEAITIDDGLARDIDCSRFPPLIRALDDAENANAREAVENLLSAVNDMNYAWKYVPYLRYDLGDEQIGQFIPFLSELQANHYRLSIALTDTCYILARAAVRAFVPLSQYLDEAAQNFDESAHPLMLQNAIREGGRKLAIDYFSLPSSLRRTTWYCGRQSTTIVLALARQTISKIADLLGSLALAWKPTSAEDARVTFVSALKQPLDSFIADRCQAWVTVVRRGTQDLIANKVLETVGEHIDSVTETLNSLTAALPEPMASNLKPGDIVRYLFHKLTMNAITFAVKKLAEKSEAYLYDRDSAPEPMDESRCRSLRWAPYIRSDDISFEAVSMEVAAEDDSQVNTEADANESNTNGSENQNNED